jgi:sulfite reductase (NADPH) flavoprotein alpha-component
MDGISHLGSAASLTRKDAFSQPNPNPPMTDTPILVLYATQTGNAAQLAADLAKRLRGEGHAVRMENMADIDPSLLLQHDRLCAVISTWGDGEPPDDAVPFFEKLREWTTPLPALRFSVCALGDSSYEKFCGSGREFHELLEKLQARYFHPMAECDVNYDKTFNVWLDGVCAKISSLAPAT